MDGFLERWDEETSDVLESQEFLPEENLRLSEGLGEYSVSEAVWLLFEMPKDLRV